MAVRIKGRLEVGAINVEHSFQKLGDTVKERGRTLTRGDEPKDDCFESIFGLRRKNQ